MARHVCSSFQLCQHFKGRWTAGSQMNNTAPNWGPWAIHWMGDVRRSSTSMTLPVYAGQIIEKSYFLDTTDEKCWSHFFPPNWNVQAIRRHSGAVVGSDTLQKGLDRGWSGVCMHNSITVHSYCTTLSPFLGPQSMYQHVLHYKIRDVARSKIAEGNQ